MSQMPSATQQTEPDHLATGIDVLERVTCAYLFLPVLLFLPFFVDGAAVTLSLLALFGAWSTLRRRARTVAADISVPLVIALALLALSWVAMAGTGHLMYANADWVVRDAVLHDLSSDSWPPSYTDASGAPAFMRAPLGYYLPAALVGKFAGFAAANIALYLWTAFGWFLFALCACRLFAKPTQRIACVLLLVGFGGMDLIGFATAYKALPALGDHIEWWMPYMQYSSNSTLLFWVPNHALPAWLCTALILRRWRQPQLALMTPLLATAVPLWSPLAAIGLFPFFLFGLRWRKDARILFSPATCLPFVPVALLIALYLGLDAASVPHAWQVRNFPNTTSFLVNYGLFCLVEFGFLALVLAKIGKFDLPVRIAVVVLCLLPFYYYGPGNDLAMRASIPALCVLAFACARVLGDAADRRTSWHAVLAIVLIVGAAGAAQEPIRTLLAKAWRPVAQSLPQAVASQQPGAVNPLPPHYVAHPDGSLASQLLRQPPPMPQPGHGGD